MQTLLCEEGLKEVGQNMKYCTSVLIYGIWILIHTYVKLNGQQK